MTMLSRLKALVGWIKKRMRLVWPTPSLGKRGEREAERYLKKKGYVILACGDRAKLGELDLIAVDGRTVVFVEVKTRTSHDAGHPADAVDERKQRRITRAALGYLKLHGLTQQASRFDVVAITWPDVKKSPIVEHIQNAFTAIGD